MALYESVFIVRQDVSSNDLDKIIDEIVAIITAGSGEIMKQEYWGLRALAYEINNNRKGHYFLLGYVGTNEILKEIERKLKYSVDVIRNITQRVEAISQDVSPILKAKSSDNEEVVDVTVTRDALAN